MRQQNRIANPLLLAGAAMGFAVGFFLGRVGRAPRPLVRSLNGNYKWMDRQERATVRALYDTGYRYLLRGWPPPGNQDHMKKGFIAELRKCFKTNVVGSGCESQRLGLLQSPILSKKPHKLESHSDVRQDDYYWVRDDKRKDPDVIAHLESENVYTKAVLADTEELQENLYKEMRKRIQEADRSVPVRLGGYYYYSLTNEGQQYRIHCRRRVPPESGPPTEDEQMDEKQMEEILLDENMRKATGKHTFYMVGEAEPSPNHELYAWAEDTVGGEKYTLHVKDISSGKEIMEPVKNTSGDLMWANDNVTLFYVVKDKLDRPYRVFRHNVYDPATKSTLIYEEGDESFYVGVSRSRDDQLLYIHSGSAITSETRYLKADSPSDDFQVILPRKQDVEYSVKHRDGYFFIVYRDEHKPNSELFVCRVDSLRSRKVLIPHKEDVKLDSISVSQSHLVIYERAGGLQRAVVYPLDQFNSSEALSTNGREVTFAEPAYSLGSGGQGDFNSNILRLAYTSLTTPTSIIDHNMLTRKRAVKKVAPVLGGFQKEKYKTERLWATAADGVKVPISVVYRNDIVKLKGDEPCLLNGYGSYEICNDPYFSSDRLSLLDRGWIFAIAHIRGGGEMGRSWYESGKYKNKKNSFTDFVTCAEYLLKNKYTAPSRLCIEGRSAGGLLMGAVTNMRPDLFNAVIMGVPFVDVLTTIEDETIPLTVIEWEEWGNPRQEDFYEYIKSYSPVDNVAPQAYPNILVTGGLHDPRVGYWEPAKLVAKIRDLRTDEQKLVLFKCDIGAGHFSVTGRFERLKEKALEFAFLLKCQGMLDVEPVAASNSVS